ncbi:hypothetical protein [Idiomarina abyssalis]|uniref:hypothetical protein n=1 Tax=Idiomarina abyssalis TaxID=86102 RepID=UPI003A8E6BA6
MSYKNSNQNIGDIGEQEFAAYCSKAGLVANKAVIDMFAWDLQIEFPVKGDHTIFDMHIPPLRCRVQVKTTTTDSRNARFKVSNLHLMATAHEPFFAALVVLDEDFDPQDIYLKHVWEDEIEQYLKWAAEATHRELKLNQEKKAIAFKEEERIKDCNKHELRKAMEDAIGADLSRYIGRKSELLSKAGQPSQMLRFRMGQADMDALLDVILQLRESAPAGEITASAKRYGLEGASSREIPEGSVMTVNNKPFNRVNLTFYEECSDDKVVLPAELYLVPSVPEVAPKLPISLISKLINFRLRPQQEEGRFFVDVISNIEYEIPYDFADLLTTTKLLDLLMKRERTAVMEIRSTDDGAQPAIAHINSHLSGDDMTPFAKGLSCIQAVFEAIGYTGDFKISLSLVHAHEIAISQLHELLLKRSTKITFSFESSKPLDCQSESVLCQVVNFPIGTLTIVTTILFKAQLAEDIEKENGYKGLTSNVEVIGTKVIENDELPTKEERLALVDAAVEPYLKTHQVIKLES